MDEIKKDENQQSVTSEETEWNPEKLEGYNGCSYFGWCANINKDGMVNRQCQNPMFYMDKLERKCRQLADKPLVMIEAPKEGEVKETVREQIKKEIIESKPKTFTVVDIIRQEYGRGNKDSGLIFTALKNIFPNEKDSDLRKRIKPTISYLEKKAGK